MPDELYCYPGSNVLRNKMGIRDMEQLREMEGKLKAEDFCMGRRRMILLSGWHIIFLRSMLCIRSGKATAGARGNSSAAWRCITDM